MPRSSPKLRLRLIAVVPVLLLLAGLGWWALDGRLPFGGGQSADGGQPPAATGVPVIEPASFDGDGLALPKKLGSLRFAVIGDVGRGDAAQFDTAAEMTRWREKFDFSFVLMLGDNMYGPGTPE